MFVQDRYETVEIVIEDLKRKFGHNVPAGQVIVNVTFGTWPHMFAKRYRTLWWDPPTSRRTQQVLPGHPKVLPSTRKEAMRHLMCFTELRNRAMHHEAIFAGVATINHPRLPIDVLHTRLLETIGWINNDALRLVSCIDQFPIVHSDVGKPTIEHAIRNEFQI